MAVVSCFERSEGRTGGNDYKGGRSYNRRFRVVTDSDLDDSLVVLSADELPTLGLPYLTDTSADPFAFVSSRNATQTDDPRVWDVDVSYESIASLDGGGGSNEPGDGAAAAAARSENPIQRPIVWSLDFVEELETVYQDLDAKPYRNSAGLYFVRQWPKFVPEITAIRNYVTFPFSVACEYANKINKDNWKGFGPGQIKTAPPKIQSMNENGYGFVQLTWKMRYNPKGWNPTKILDKGPFYKTGLLLDKIRPFVDAGGNNYEGLLDGISGQRAPVDANGNPIPKFLNFVEHEKINFKGIL